MEQYFDIVREIGIDAGHRVTHHGSKCRNLHGHRYTVKAVVRGRLVEQGQEQGMVMDFGFLKDEMMDVIDAPADHGLMLWVHDPILQDMLGEGNSNNPMKTKRLVNQVAEDNWALTYIEPYGKVLVLQDVPTAENLARHWYYELRPRVLARTDNCADLVQVQVWETPNCMARYPI